MENVGEIGQGRPPFEPPDGGGGSSWGKATFRDKLMGGVTMPPRKEKVDLISMNHFRIEYEEGDRLRPKCFVEENIVQELWKPWVDAVFVKLLGKPLGFRIMKEKLKSTWKLGGEFDLMDVGNGFFIVKFDRAEDKSKVVENGPWMIFDHYLSIRPWVPNFVSSEARIERTMAWIRFPNLGLEYYDESILLALASAVGKPLKVDTMTMGVVRGRFARVCVELELDRPVVGKVWFRNHWFKVEYEGLHLLCSKCGCYGHLSRACSHKEAADQVTTNGLAHAAMAEGGGEGPSVQVEGTAGEHVNPSQSTNVIQGIQLHGDWLMVSRNKRGAKSKENLMGGNKLQQQQGRKENKLIASKNKYDVLNGIMGEKSIESNHEQSIVGEPDFVFNADTAKVWTRKKRQRKDRLSPLPKNNFDSNIQIVVDRVESNYVSHKPPLESGDHMPMPKGNDTNVPIVKSHDHGIFTTMNIEVAGPNHFRFVDEPDPPDTHFSLGCVEGKDKGVMINGSPHDVEEEVEMVVETPGMRI
ncbi:uncharacterized protein LOC109793062 [Cajanus cajan]|uniref:uncharacterized protein LOC109793062 n=1 Tax=Cajanus cajan TaxID=3821 RepID=UPI00098D7FE9|nr:uncharacterized protein LOC109793062 [Cajanus cajan]